MSTGNSRPQDFYQFSGGDQGNQGDRVGDNYQFSGDGQNRFQEEVYNVPRGAVANYALPMDRQGYPIINNYGTMNVFMAGGNGYDDASVRAMQAAKLNDMMSGRYDNYRDDREYWAPEYNRLSDFRREALIRDGQQQDQMIRSYYSRDLDPYYGRQFNNGAYRRPGQYTSYSHGGPDGLSYYESGPSYARNQPWMIDDCFGTGRNGGDMRAFQDILRTTLPAIIAFKHADNNRGGRWDRGYDRYGGYDRGYNGMNPIEYMLMDRAINGDRYAYGRNPRMYGRNDQVAYSHGGPDGLSYYNSTPRYDQYMGPRSGFESAVNDILPIAQTVLPFVVAMKHADNADDNPRYRPRHNAQPYYRENGNYQMAYNRARHDYLQQQRQAQVDYNRQRAMERRYYG